MPVVEVVCCSVEDVLTATRAGADRIELCASIEAGGLTPSIGTIREAIVHAELPIVVLIRCRAGAFRYSPAELRVMRRDAEAAVDAGAAGVAFGALASDGRIDSAACEEVIGRLQCERVFHRAFDETPDLGVSLAAAMGLGFTRVLTSGGGATALEGADCLARLRGQGIQIVAAGGIRSGNAAEVVRLSGVDQIHLGPFVGGECSGKFGTELRLDGAEVARVCAAVGAK